MENKTKEVTLFLVEDDDVDAMTIERSFKKSKIGNPIIRAIDGLHALDLMRADEVSRPYILLLDLHMPRMGGIEFLEELRRDEFLANTVVFVLTTSKVETDIFDSYKYNIAGYYLKEEAGESFMNIVNVLESYWKVVHLPNENPPKVS